MRIRNIMSRPAHTVRGTDAILTGGGTVGRHNVTAAPVLDDDGCLAGIVSESDLLWDRLPPEHAVLSLVDTGDLPPGGRGVPGRYMVGMPSRRRRR